MRTVAWCGRQAIPYAHVADPGRLFSYPTPIRAGSVLDGYSYSLDGHRALSRCLVGSPHGYRCTLPARGAHSTHVLFAPSPTDVQLLFDNPALGSATSSLHNFFPYLAHAGREEALAFLADGLSRHGIGTGSSQLSFKEREFLCRRALPKLVAHKLEAARAAGERMVTFGIKCFGLGDCDAALAEIVRCLLHEYGQQCWRRTEPPVIRVVCTVFENDPLVLGEHPQPYTRRLQDAARVARCANRLLLEFEGYYGDITCDRAWPIMCAHGAHDIIVWRMTMALNWYHRSARFGWDRMVTAMMDRISRPGIILVNEGDLTVRELVA